jgi:hypothetical protein
MFRQRKPRQYSLLGWKENDVAPISCASKLFQEDVGLLLILW